MNSFRSLMVEMNRLSSKGDEVTAREATLLWDAFIDKEGVGERRVDPNIIAARSYPTQVDMTLGRVLLKFETYNEATGLTPVDSRRVCSQDTRMEISV